MSANTSAVLDVVSENADITSIVKDGKETNVSHNDCSSMIQSASIDSFSTIQDIENLSELNVDENSDLCIKIDNPQKHLETLETYITFRIKSKVARIEFSENEYVVRRRYNDFLWLRQKLFDCHPFCIIPPLPAKHSLIGQLDRYSKDFILVRMKALNVFISRVVQHPILSCNQYFKLFITVKQPDFNVLRRQRSNSDGKQVAPSSLTHSVLKNKHIEFEKIKSYLNLLVEKVNSFERISNRIQKERNELMVEVQYFYPHLQYWANTEPDLAKLLNSIAHSIVKDLGAQNDLVGVYSTLITTPVKDFVTYVDVVQEALQKREIHQAVYESSVEELNKKRADKDKLMPGGSSQPQVSGFSLWKQQSSDEKLEKLGVTIPQLTKKMESNQDNLECANEQLRSDVERWQTEKQQLVKKILLDFVNKQIEYYEQSVKSWESARDRFSQNVPK